MEKVLMKGNQAFAEACLRAGCRFFSGYPITPPCNLPFLRPPGYLYGHQGLTGCPAHSGWPDKYLLSSWMIKTEQKK